LQQCAIRGPLEFIDENGGGHGVRLRKRIPQEAKSVGHSRQLMFAVCATAVPLQFAETVIMNICT
jgi:hypothetical protein